MNRPLISAALGGIREEYIAAALCYSPSEERRRTERSRQPSDRRWITLLLATALLLALAVTAYAAGLFDSLFPKIPNEYAPEPEREWYERAGELSEKEPETVALRDLPKAAFTLTESFYDGKDLIVAYDLDTMKYPVQFGFGPGDDGFEKLWPTGPWYINAQWENEVFTEDYQRICRALREEERTGFVLRHAYVGDHVRLTDGTDLGPWAGGASLDGNVYMEWREVEESRIPDGSSAAPRQGGLPEKARNQPELELQFTVREVLMYYYKDGDTMYLYSETIREEPVTVTIPRAAVPEK